MLRCYLLRLLLLLLLLLLIVPMGNVSCRELSCAQL
jgi:hypothetical protein